MKIELLYPGQKFSIYAVVMNDGSCPAIEFLEALKKNSTASFRTLVNIYTRHADHGHIKNVRKSRPIETFDGLFEFKSSQNDRLLYFYLLGGKTVISHGFHSTHKKAMKTEYKKAEAIRTICIKECENV